MTAVLTLVSFLDMIFFLQSISSSIITWIFSNSSFWSWNLNPISTTNHQLTMSKMNTYTIIMFSLLIFSIDSCQLSQDHFFFTSLSKVISDKTNHSCNFSIGVFDYNEVLYKPGRTVSIWCAIPAELCWFPELWEIQSMSPVPGN